MTIKYLKNYLSFYFSHILAGTTNYEERIKAYYSLRTARIKRKKLAALLSQACTEKDGVLTYPEYLILEQFSRYGYHGTHLGYGGTPVAKYWPKALVALCQQQNIHSLVEFGPGEGALGAYTVKEALKQHHDLSWSGIEIDTSLQQDILGMFKSKKISQHLLTVTTTLEEMIIPEKSLFVFSYSLDSIPPLLFTNTTNKKSYPNALIGVRVHGQELEEVILSKDMLKKKHLSLEKGIFTNEHGQKYDLRDWQLVPYQRTYLTLPSFFTLQQTVAKLPKGSFVLIIDEFRESLPFWNTEHMFVPRDVEMFDRDMRNIQKFYETAGENILYYVSFVETYMSLLKQLGCTQVQFTEEQEAIASIRLKKPFSNVFSSFSKCHAILAKVPASPLHPPILSIPYPQNKSH